MAAYIRSAINNSVLNTVIIEFSKRNESHRNCLDLPLLVSVSLFDTRLSYEMHSCLCDVSASAYRGFMSMTFATIHYVLKILLSRYLTHGYSLQIQYMQPHFHRNNHTPMYFSRLF